MDKRKKQARALQKKSGMSLRAALNALPQIIRSFHTPEDATVTFSARCTSCRRWIWCGYEEHNGACTCGRPYRVQFGEQDWKRVPVDLVMGMRCMLCGAECRLSQREHGRNPWHTVNVGQMRCNGCSTSVSGDGGSPPRYGEAPDASATLKRADVAAEVSVEIKGAIGHESEPRVTENAGTATSQLQEVIDGVTGTAASQLQEIIDSFTGTSASQMQEVIDSLRNSAAIEVSAAAEPQLDPTRPLRSRGAGAIAEEEQRLAALDPARLLRTGVGAIAEHEQRLAALDPARLLRTGVSAIAEQQRTPDE